MSYTFTFTDDQHTMLICGLILAALEYADPDLAIETLRLIAPKAAEVTEQHLLERAAAE